MSNQLPFIKPNEFFKDDRELALKLLPESGHACAMEILEDYFESLGDKKMAWAIRRMRCLKKNIVATSIENTIFSAYDRKGIKERIRQRSSI